MIDVPHSPLLQAILGWGERTPDKVALIKDGTEVSYAALCHNILAAARFLMEQGLCRGDVIVLSARKELEFVYVYFAAQLIGLRNVIMDPGSSEERKAFVIGQTRPKAIFGFAWEGVRVIAYKDVDLRMTVTSVASLSVDDVAEIMFTTGTTGKPKGVQLTHYNIYSSASNINSFMGNGTEDTEALGLPLCHSFGLGRLRCTLLKGATMVLLGNFANIKAVFQSFERYGVTMFGMVPAVWAYIRKYSGTRISRYASQMRFIEIGSAPMGVRQKEELVSMFPDTRICMHYGLTEASRSAFMEFHAYRDKLASIGRPVTDEVDIKIFDENGKAASEGQEGEICVKGNMVMKGYLNADDQRDAFFGDYFRTGDLGYKDCSGDLFLTGRLKELINVGGKKVSPQEIEDAIEALGVGECICVGMEDRGGVLGQVVKAYMVRGEKEVGVEAIRKALSTRLEAYKVPAEYEWVAALPKTSSGKKQRMKLMNN